MPELSTTVVLSLQMIIEPAETDGLWVGHWKGDDNLAVGPTFEDVYYKLVSVRP